MHWRVYCLHRVGGARMCNTIIVPPSSLGNFNSAAKCFFYKRYHEQLITNNVNRYINYSHWNKVNFRDLGIYYRLTKRPVCLGRPVFTSGPERPEFFFMYKWHMVIFFKKKKGPGFQSFHWIIYLNLHAHNWRNNINFEVMFFLYIHYSIWNVYECNFVKAVCQNRLSKSDCMFAQWLTDMKHWLSAHFTAAWQVTAPGWRRRTCLRCWVCGWSCSPRSGLKTSVSARLVTRMCDTSLVRHMQVFPLQSAGFSAIRPLSLGTWDGSGGGPGQQGAGPPLLRPGAPRWAGSHHQSWRWSGRLPALLF